MASHAAIPAFNMIPSQPISPAQRRWWYLHRVVADPGVLNLGCSIHLPAGTEVRAIESAFHDIVARHDILRTKFDPDEPFAVILDRVHARLDLSSSSFDAQLRRPFRLDAAPLIRAGLIGLEEGGYQLWVVAHPLVFDRFSAKTILDELVQKQSVTAPISYREFAESQRSCLSGRAWADEIEALRPEFVNPPVLDLPSDYARPAFKNYAGAAVETHISMEKVTALRELAIKQGSDLPSFLFGTWGALLYRHTEHPAIVVGQLVPNRPPSTEQAIGPFENALPVLIRFNEGQPFSEYLREVRSSLQGAQKRASVPFEHLIDELHSGRDLSRSPLCQTLFAYDTIPHHPAWAGCATDLALTCGETQDGLNLWLTYSSELFSDDTAKRFLDRFEALLAQLSAEPDCKLGDLNPMTQAEAAQISDWNQTSVAFPQISALEMFEAMAAKNPRKEAVNAVSGSLTYGELDELSNTIGARLVSLGIGAGSLVGVYMNRTPELIATLLGIWKAGAGYLPLDPAFPRDRLNFIAEDSGIRVVACSRELVSSIPGDNLTAIITDDSEAAWRKTPAAKPDCRAGSEDIAYVLYTSGSTGTPKGVQIPNRAVSNLVHAMQLEPGISSADSVLALTTISFDISVLEIFVPLSAGARIVLADRQTAMDPRMLLRRVEQTGVTLMQATPATWQSLIDSGWRGKSGLRIITGGEALSSDLASQLLGRCAEVWNLYGPTEVTVWATAAKVETPHRIVIGRPIKNTTAYIVDRRMRPAPIGTPGELCLGGVQVALGYRGLPEKTAERFVPNPFNGGGLLYRTGDLARFLPDGNIEYLGRTDHQVKIRGFRIELGEIETVLLEQKGVAKAVVVPIEDQGGKRLAAYLVGQPDVLLNEDELLAGLKRKLPDYMVPAHFIMLDRLPLTPNGKVDRLALPKPEGRSASNEKCVPARDELENRLVSIWESVLGVKPIGIHDDFFRLGGDSLLAVRVMVDIEAELHRKVPLAVLFQAPTIAQLAHLIRESETIEFSCLVPIQTGGSRPALFLVHGLGGNVVGYHTLALELGPDQPIYGLQAVGLDGSAAPLDDIHAMAERYVAELLRVQSSGPYHLGGLSLGGVIALEMARRLQDLGHEVALIIMLDAYAFGVEKLGNASRRAKMTVTSAALRASFHLRNLFSQDLMGKLNYVRRKTHTIKRRILWKLRSEQYKTYLRGADELPGTYNAVAHAMWAAMKQYSPAPYRGRMLVLRADDDAFMRNNDPTLGWGGLVDPKPTVVKVPGAHLTFLEAPHVTAVAAAIQAGTMDHEATATDESLEVASLR